MSFFTSVWAFLQGKKTYFVVAVGVINAFLNTSTPEAFFTQVFPLLGLAAVRNGVAAK